MRCPKCGGEIRIQTDVCPFCGVILPPEMKNAYNGASAESTFYHPVSQTVNEEAAYTANGTQNRNTAPKSKMVRKRKRRKQYKPDDLSFEARTQLNQEIIILLLFVLIIIGMLQLITLRTMR